MKIRYDLLKPRLAAGQRAGAQNQAQQRFCWHTKKIADFEVRCPSCLRTKSRLARPNLAAAREENHHHLQIATGCVRGDIIMTSTQIQIEHAQIEWPMGTISI